MDQHRCTYSSKSVEPFRKQFLEQSVAADSGRNALQYYDRNFVMCDSDILVILIKKKIKKRLVTEKSLCYNHNDA